MWLSEQIPTRSGYVIKERADVNKLYQKHLEMKDVERNELKYI